MVQSDKTKECFKNLLGWKEHFNSEISIEPNLSISETGEYFQDFHPALALNIISQTLEKGRDLSQYLAEKVEVATTQLLNDIESKRQAEGLKDLLASETILNKYGWANDTIFNENRFVGFMFEPKESVGLTILLQGIALQLTTAQTLPLYLYHSSQIEALKIFNFDITTPISWNWLNEVITLHSKNENIQGGTFYIGYYQNDLIGSAINYTDFDWNVGHCGTCDGGVMRNVWNRIKKYSDFMPFYVPNANLTQDRFMFDPKAVMIDPLKSWGMNFKVAVTCDLTDFFCANRKNLKNALGLKVAYLVLQDIKFSQQFNYINEDIKNLIIRDLEGDKDTYNFGIASKLKKEIDDVFLNTSKISKFCLPCIEKGGVEYGVA